MTREGNGTPRSERITPSVPRAQHRVRELTARGFSFGDAVRWANKEQDLGYTICYHVSAGVPEFTEGICATCWRPNPDLKCIWCHEGDRTCTLGHQIHHYPEGDYHDGCYGAMRTERWLAR